MVRVSEQVKAHTKQAHQVLEKLIVGKIARIASPEDYQELLSIFYSYFGGLENSIGQFVSTRDLPDLPIRRKTDLIAHDIQNLGFEIPGQTSMQNLPAISNLYEAFGAMYVMEGSSLGGVHIAKMISRKLPDMQDVFLFFTGYGNQTSEMWEQFKRNLDSIPKTDEQINMILSGAQETFLKFAAWINSNRPQVTLI